MKLKYWGLSFFLCLGLLNPALAADTPKDPKVLHLLNRLTFGPRPGDIQKVESLGIDRYIQEQLSPQSPLDPLLVSYQLAQSPTLHQNPIDILKQYNSPATELPTQQGQKPNQQAIQQARNELSRQAMQQALQSRLVRAAYNPQQLQEVMVDFWYNHFNVYSDKGLDRIWIGVYEEQALRPYALGRFRDLLGATAHHPAMLFYLDNSQNRVKGLNENYARELMELHTLGVDGGYTQQDVIALAHILTGWSFCRPGQKADTDYGFCFNKQQHDFGDKVFLGQTIKGSGIGEGEQALDILARHPATARHISYQLAQYFVADQPPPSLVNHLAQRFQETDGDIRAVLSTLFHSSEFWDQKNYNAKFKTPYQYIVSALRATDTPITNFTPISDMLQQLGMPLFGCLTPDGYKNTEDIWLNPDAMTRRLSFATLLANGSLPLGGMLGNKDLMPNQVLNNHSTQSNPVDALQLATTVGNSFSQQTETTLSTSPPQLRAALILGSPEFMRR